MAPEKVLGAAAVANPGQGLALQRALGNRAAVAALQVSGQARPSRGPLAERLVESGSSLAGSAREGRVQREIVGPGTDPDVVRRFETSIAAARLMLQHAIVELGTSTALPIPTRLMLRYCFGATAANLDDVVSKVVRNLSDIYRMLGQADQVYVQEWDSMIREGTHGHVLSRRIPQPVRWLLGPLASAYYGKLETSRVADSVHVNFALRSNALTYTLIHEASHYANATDDVQYISQGFQGWHPTVVPLATAANWHTLGTGWASNDRPADAQNNADSYSVCVFALNGFPMPAL